MSLIAGNMYIKKYRNFSELRKSVMQFSVEEIGKLFYSEEFAKFNSVLRALCGT